MARLRANLDAEFVGVRQEARWRTFIWTLVYGVVDATIRARAVGL